MECAVPLGCTNKAIRTWCQTAAGDHIGLTSELWLFVHFNKHTMAAFQVKCIHGGTHLWLTTHPPAPTTHPLLTESMIF